MLQNRLVRALSFIGPGSATLLVYGDHGRTDYVEVGAIRAYLLDKDVPAETFSWSTPALSPSIRSIGPATFSWSVGRRGHQDASLAARALHRQPPGPGVQGVASDLASIRAPLLRLREFPARFKAFLDCVVLRRSRLSRGNDPDWRQGLDTVD
jgi:hypothetical protein